MPPKYGGGLKCGICEKTVYEQEKIEAGDVAYHKTCFKCSKCNMSLNRNNYGSALKVLYCKNHFQSEVLAKNAQIVS